MAYEEMKCPKCKATVSENAKFCTACGTKLKSKKKESRPKWWLIVLVAVIGFSALRNNGLFEKLGFKGSFFTADSEDEESVKWEDLVLSSKLPRPEHKKVGCVYNNTEEKMYVRLEEVTEAGKGTFINACKEMGYHVDVEYSSSSFDVYNDEGYHLNLSLWSSDDLTIDLEAPMKMETIRWPDSEMAKLLPVPKSTTGKINRNDEDGFSVYIGNTTIDDYNAYVKACEEKGFTVDAQKQDKTFSARNTDSNKLSVDYEGNNVIYISVSEPEFDVTVEVECIENWIFSKYDVELSIDDEFEGTIPHGDKETFDVVLKRGKHTISFESAEDDTLDGEVEVEITKNETIKLKISCFSYGVDVEFLSGTAPKDEDSSKEITSNTEDTQKPADKAGAPDVWTNLLERHYEDVKKQFEDAGFTNVTCVPHEIDFNEENVFEGSVVNVAVGEDGDICTFEKGEQWPKDIKIRIDYRVKLEKPVENITIENNTDFASLMKITDQTDTTTIKAFVNAHKGKTIEFDGCIALMMKHENYKTRFDVCMAGGNYGADRVYGPLFSFEDVNYSDMNVSGSDAVAQGMNFRITAKIIGFSDAGGYIILEPVALIAH